MLTISGSNFLGKVNKTVQKVAIITPSGGDRILLDSHYGLDGDGNHDSHLDHLEGAPMIAKPSKLQINTDDEKVLALTNFFSSSYSSKMFNQWHTFYVHGLWVEDPTDVKKTESLVALKDPSVIAWRDEHWRSCSKRDQQFWIEEYNKHSGPKRNQEAYFRDAKHAYESAKDLIAFFAKLSETALTNPVRVTDIQKDLQQRSLITKLMLTCKKKGVAPSTVYYLEEIRITVNNVTNTVVPRTTWDSSTCGADIIMREPSRQQLVPPTTKP
uniref:Zinc ABC transporter substrate-binding protein n=1 Tax=Steinernema glaseri TaxID=37863 RepID=A0A1I7ZSY3_9BILA